MCRAGRWCGCVGSASSGGIPTTAPSDFFEKRLVVNSDLFGLLEQGRIEPRPWLRALDGKHVIFQDGTREEVDVVVAATGYRFTLPFLSQALLGQSPEDLCLYRGVMHPRHHDLFVIGVMKAICSIWPRSEQQMAFVAPLLSGEYALPGQQEIDRESYPILRVPFGNCQFHTHDLRRELARGRRRAGSSAARS